MLPEIIPLGGGLSEMVRSGTVLANLAGCAGDAGNGHGQAAAAGTGCGDRYERTMGIGSLRNMSL